MDAEQKVQTVSLPAGPPRMRNNKILQNLFKTVKLYFRNYKVPLQKIARIILIKSLKRKDDDNRVSLNRSKSPILESQKLCNISSYQSSFKTSLSRLTCHFGLKLNTC